MILRARLEAVLKRHSRYEMSYQGHPTPLVCQLLPALVDDLLACVSTPSRERLNAIWEAKVSRHRQHWFEWEGQKKRLTDAVLDAWATGQPAKTWCGHCVWDAANHEWVLTHSADLFEKGDATCSRVIRSDRIDHPQWQFCPICAAPRPT